LTNIFSFFDAVIDKLLQLVNRNNNENTKIMKRISNFIFMISAATLLLTLNSCSKWLDPGDNTKVTWGTITTDTHQQEVEGNYPFYVITDDTLLFCPVNHTSIDEEFEPIDGDRLILYYTIHGDDQEGEEAQTDVSPVQYIDIVQMHLVDTEDFIYTGEPDTLGTDRVEPQYLWFAGGGFGSKRYLNLQVSIQAMDPTKHSFALIYDLNRETPLEDGYYCLELRHKSNNDPLYTNFSTMMAYPLEGECVEEGVKGLKIKVNTINQGEKVFTLDY
jgi:hypothetical protein